MGFYERVLQYVPAELWDSRKILAARLYPPVRCCSNRPSQSWRAHRKPRLHGYACSHYHTDDYADSNIYTNGNADCYVYTDTHDCAGFNGS